MLSSVISFSNFFAREAIAVPELNHFQGLTHRFSNGQVRNLEMGLEDDRLYQRLAALDLIEKVFISQKRGLASENHQKILKTTLNLMTSEQRDAYTVN